MRTSARMERRRREQPATGRLGFVFVSVLLVACSGSGAPDPLPDEGAGARGAYVQSPSAACIEGVQRPCKIVLSKHGDVTTCFAGSQTCAGGAWGACAAMDPILPLDTTLLEFAAECGPGERATWTALDYVASVDAKGSIEIAVQTIGPAGALAPAQPAVVARVPAADPPSCSRANAAADPAACEKDLASALGAAADADRLVVGVHASHGPKSASALTLLQPSFVCRP